MLIYNSFYISDVNAERKRFGASADCWDLTKPPGVLCCWQEKDTNTGLIHDVCRVCYDGPPVHCADVSDKILGHVNTNQHNNKYLPLKGGGILEQDKQTPSNNSKIQPPTGLVS